MDYKTFEKKIRKISQENDVEAKIWHDDEKGIHRAKLSNGMRVTGNSYSNKLTWKWGSGHCLMSEI